MWLSKCPEGPSVKFHVENVHTMAELKLTGNHLKFSRPVGPHRYCPPCHPTRI
jgi:ribosome biogenesis protein BRX1